MTAFRDKMAKELGIDLLVHINQDGVEQGVGPFTHGSNTHTHIMKTVALRQALDKYGFDAAFGGARRDEEKSRAKERIFSFRKRPARLGPEKPAPGNVEDLQHPCRRRRIDPRLPAVELDRTRHLAIYHEGKHSIVPLYYAAKRPVVERDGMIIMVDDERMPIGPDDIVEERLVRFRTLGCYPLTGAIESDAANLQDIVREMLTARTSERQGRLIDKDEAGSMEKKKREGYF